MSKSHKKAYSTKGNYKKEDTSPQDQHDYHISTSSIATCNIVPPSVMVNQLGDDLNIEKENRVIDKKKDEEGTGTLLEERPTNSNNNNAVYDQSAHGFEIIEEEDVSKAVIHHLEASVLECVDLLNITPHELYNIFSQATTRIVDQRYNEKRNSVWNTTCSLVQKAKPWALYNSRVLYSLACLVAFVTKSETMTKWFFRVLFYLIMKRL
jgi:hypothetical protein